MVYEIIRHCKICVASKRGTLPKKAAMRTEISGRPFERIAIDCMTKMPDSKGYTNIVNIICYFTKYVVSVPTKDIKAKTICDLIVNNIICVFGVPERIHTDQGTEFENDLVEGLCKLFDITKTKTSAYHPQSDGAVERFHRVLGGMIRSYVEELGSDWSDYLQPLLLAYRSAIHKATGYSPNEMIFGKNVVLPVDLEFGWNFQGTETVTAFHEKTRSALQIAHWAASMHLQKYVKGYTEKYNRKSKDRHFSEGELVWFYSEIRRVKQPAKMQRFWSGPYLIVKKLGEVTYQIKRKYGKPKVVHINKIKAYVEEKYTPTKCYLPEGGSHSTNEI